MRAMTMAVAMAMAMAIASASLMEKKQFFQIFFFNTAKLFRLGGILAFWPSFGILAHASKSAGIVALFSFANTLFYFSFIFILFVNKEEKREANLIFDEQSPELF